MPRGIDWSAKCIRSPFYFFIYFFASYLTIYPAILFCVCFLLLISPSKTKRCRFFFCLFIARAKREYMHARTRCTNNDMQICVGIRFCSSSFFIHSLFIFHSDFMFQFYSFSIENFLAWLWLVVSFLQPKK